ncbi:MAG: hypothetical protein CBD95_003850 [Flavobacteriales bacterium TMED235]|nr:MAG: hypothetical protein CBD95_003850 [Flavobacteriales bacterium TMED235]|tara:strand:+ start:101 stop:826 length:726 start_codon:yes stop_codon:yes gene_type:complete
MSFLKKISEKSNKYNSTEIFNFFQDLSKIEKKIPENKILDSYYNYLKQIWKILGKDISSSYFKKDDGVEIDYDEIKVGYVFENFNLKNFERKLMIIWEAEYESILGNFYSYKDLKKEKDNKTLNVLLYNNQPLWWRPFFEYQNTGLSKIEPGKKMYISSINKDQLDQSMKVIKEMIKNKNKILDIGSYAFNVDITATKETFLGKKEKILDVKSFKIDNKISDNLDKFFENFATKILNLNLS